MRERRGAALVIGAALAAAPIIVNAQSAPSAPNTGVSEARVVAPLPSLAPMIKRVSPAVVSIAIKGTIREQAARNPLLDDPFFRRFFNIPPGAGVRERQFQSAGSGVVVDAKRGYIVTNAHVVDNAKEITVTLFDERELAAKIVGSDPRTDIAVIQVTPERLTEISLGDSDRLEPGDYVAAIGNPFGLQHSVSSGIVSALGRSGLNPDGYESLIQTDASINPGNSGGALVNLRGELVGINNMILSGSGGNIGIGFAIPVNMARSVMQQLIEFGAVKRGQLGVAVASLTPDVAQALGLPNGSGAVINQVAADSAAARAGLRAGDVVTTVNGKTVKSAADFRNAIGLLRVGDKVEVAVLRDGQTRRLSALIPEPPAVAKANELASSEAANGLHRGFEGAALDDADDNEGVLVRSVANGSAAAIAGLRANDVVIAANGARVGDRKQLRAAWQAAAARGATTLVLQVRRNGELGVVLLR
ncbi:MAG: Do family serine endopeptidase [Steroidobacteraceae bacterium]|jgi:serine protease Do/serine protease DegQ